MIHVSLHATFLDSNIFKKKFPEEFIKSKLESLFYDGVHTMPERSCKVVESQEKYFDS